MRREYEAARKGLLIVGLTIIVLLGILYAASAMIMMNGVAQMEQKTTDQSVDRFLDALSHEVSDLDKTAFDLAVWDDTYVFVQNVNTAYVNSNLADATFINLRLNFMLFFNTSGQMVFGKAINLLNETEIPIPQSLLEHLATHSDLLQHENTNNSISGIILLPEMPVFVASRPILTSLQQGPISGALVVGRFLDSEELNAIYERVHLPLTVQALGVSQMPADFQTANQSLSKETPVFIQPLGAGTISGYALVMDVYENPILIFRIDLPRDLYAQGLISAFYVNVMLIVVGLVFCVMTIWLLEKFVLSRLSRLSGDVKRIEESGDIAARVPLNGKDELAALATGINKMLSSLDNARGSLCASETRLRQITENMFDMVSMTDAKGIYQYVGPSVKRTLGYEPIDLLGKSIFDFLHPDDSDKVKEAIKTTLETKMSGNMEYRYKHKDGHYLWLEGAGSLLLDDKGQVVGAVLSSHDITERKRMEEQIKESEGRLQRLIEYAPEAIYTSDLNGVFLDGNKQAEEITGYKKEELIGKSFLELDILPEKYLPKIVEMLQKNINGEKAGAEELELIRKDGSTVYIEVSAFPIQRAGKVEVVGIARDITERKRMEEQLRESEERFRGIAVRSFDGIAIVDNKGTITYASPSVGKVLGYPQSEVIGKSFLEYFPPTALSNAEQLFTNLMQGKSFEGLQLELPKRDGTIATVETNVSPIIIDGEVTGIQAVFRDITERKKTEQTLRESEEKYRLLFENVNDVVFSYDSEFKILSVSPSVTRALGYKPEELVGKHFQDLSLMTPESMNAAALNAMRVLSGESIGTVVYEFIKKDGTRGFGEVSGSPIISDGKIVGVISVGRDITERKNAEKAILESQQKFERLFKSNPDASVYVDANDRFLDANPRFIELFGYSLRSQRKTN